MPDLAADLLTVEPCTAEGCTKPARMAIRTIRVERADLKVTLHLDNRGAPKLASRYCKACGTALAAEIVATLVDGDDA